MPSLIAYRKATDAITTHTLRLPTPEKMGDASGQEIATLEDGRTIVVLPDGATLPTDQPAEIKDSIEVLPTPLPDALKEQIREASPHVRLINARMQERIRARYSIEDEMKFSRLLHKTTMGLGTLDDGDKTEILAYDKHVEDARAWAKGERAKLGV
jgi:hypothetical protein